MLSNCSVGWPDNEERCRRMVNLCFDVLNGKIPKENFTLHFVSINNLEQAFFKTKN
jgi:hypothetical protein